MENRLTKRNEQGKAVYADISCFDENIPLERLASYEDCGLPPEGVRKLQKDANLAFAKVEHYEGYGLTMQELDDLVQAKKEGRISPVAHWIVVGKTDGGANILQCSHCKRERKGRGKSSFCPDCGAMMVGGVDNG